MITTIFGCIIVAIATFATMYFSTKAIVSEETDRISVAIVSALVSLLLTALSIMACVWHWWLFAPIVIILAGIWQKFSYSHCGWLMLIGLLLVAWSAGNLNIADFNDVVNLILGRFVYPLATALIYTSLSLKSLEEDNLEEKIEEIVDEKLGR